MYRFRICTLTFLCIVMIGLVGCSKNKNLSRIEPYSEPELPPNYMLGYFNPSESAGYVTFADETPSKPDSIVLESQDSGEVVRLINLKRTSRKLPPLIFSPILTRVAQAHSKYMKDHSCFAHQCAGEPPPSKRACLAGYRSYKGSCYIGETIAGGYPSPKSVVNAWMNSPGHRAILMHSKLREIGVGLAVGGYYRAYWTVDLGSQRNKLYVFINNDESVTESRSVILTLTNEEISSSDGIGYAHDVMISNDPSFADTDWEPYAPHKPWTLTSGKGPKTVYVKYRDPTGHKVISGDIIFLK